MSITGVNELIHRYYKSSTIVDTRVRSAIEKFNKNKSYTVISDHKNNYYVIESKHFRSTRKMTILEEYLNSISEELYCAIVKYKRKVRALYFDAEQYSNKGVISVSKVEKAFDCKFLI